MSQSSVAMEVVGEANGTSNVNTPRPSTSVPAATWLEAAYDEGVAMERAGDAEGAAQRFLAIATLTADSLDAALVSMGDLAPQNSATIKEEDWKKLREASIIRLCSAYASLNNASALVELLAKARRLFSTMAKAKTAKIVRTVIDSLQRIPGTETLQSDLCEEYIQWCKEQKRTFLRQRIEAKLAALHVSQKRFQAALKLLTDLQAEVKKLDDKQLLVEIFLVESKAHHALKNLPKAKASLTSARSAANSIYVGPRLQVEIDMQGGRINADEKDYRTAYSYFFEAFEGLTTLKDTRAALSLRYMLLCKIMNKQSNEVSGLLRSKHGIKHAGEGMQGLQAVAKAYEDRSLEKFNDALKAHADELLADELIARHLKFLNTDLLEQNLCRIIEPYSRVEVSRVAQLINMPEGDVYEKLSQMILDQKFRGTLDQGSGHLIVFDEEPQSSEYADSLKAMKDLGLVVDNLFSLVKARRLNAQ